MHRHDRTLQFGSNSSRLCTRKHVPCSIENGDPRGALAMFLPHLAALDRQACSLRSQLWSTRGSHPCNEPRGTRGHKPGGGIVSRIVQTGATRSKDQAYHEITCCKYRHGDSVKRRAYIVATHCLQAAVPVLHNWRRNSRELGLTLILCAARNA